MSRVTWKLRRARPNFCAQIFTMNRANCSFAVIEMAGATVEGFADDYAFVVQGLLDLYEASFDIEWLKFATQLQETQDRLFFDEKNGGYFTTSGKDASVLLRMKDDNDSAEPAASSIAALNLLRLSQILR